MTSNYHTPIVTGEAANAAKINAPLGMLDAAVGQAAQLAQLAAETVALNGSGATLANGAASAGQKVVNVDDSSIFVPGCLAQYRLAGGELETNTVATVNSATQITLSANIGAGGIADNGLVATLPVGVYNMRVGVHNVMDYGARGDGVTDDTAAIQAAINAAAATVGRIGVVQLPARTFAISDTLIINTNSVRLCGTGGMFGTTLVTTAAKPAIKVSGYQNSIERLYCNCNNVGTIGVVLDDANECELQQVLVINATDCGIELKGTGICAGITMERVWTNCALGIRIGTASNIWINRANLYGATSFKFTGSASDIYLSQSWFEAFTTFADFTTTTYGIVIDSFHVTDSRFQSLVGSGANSARILLAKTTNNTYAALIRDVQIRSCDIAVYYAKYFVEIDWDVYTAGGSSRFWATMRDCHVTAATNTTAWVKSDPVDGNYEYVRILIDNPTHAGSAIPLQDGTTRAVAYAPRQYSGTAAPTAGPWLRGDIVWNNDPSAAEYVGWVCVSAGSPGTWKGFGAIQA